MSVTADDTMQEHDFAYERDLKKISKILSLCWIAFSPEESSNQEFTNTIVTVVRE